MNKDLMADKLELISNDSIAALTSSDTQLDSLINGAHIVFEHDEYDAGSVSQGTIVTHSFIFTNKGNKDLEIYSVVPDCSCTSPKWTIDPIPPGKSGEILISYDSKDDLGKLLKTITVVHNAGEGHSFIELRGFVEGKF